ncbi:Glycerate dehydrogenase [Mycena venus]|uniref:Glycerate dehydrogenase n=1 Tax=Mycena venus TaxID=2733690 RepID=A0A8H6YJN6_9AGAR|nr:Glycerate dehydrogenase [Mycena venus]
MAQRFSSSLKPLLARRTMSGLSSRPSLAILDDYLDTSAPHFAHIPSDQLHITTFKDTIVPINEAETARLVERLKPFDLIATMRARTSFPGSLLRQLPNLKLLLATGTQFETFDLAAAKEFGIPVVAAPGLGRTGSPLRPNIKKGGAHPTTQHTWALILALARNIAADDALLKSTPGAWQSGLATGLTGRTLGLVGLGRLGAAVARIGHLAWGMRVVCWSASLTQDKADAMAAEVGLSPDEGIGGEKTFLAVSKGELFTSADVVSLHYVLSARSRGLVGAQELGLMKPDALLVNASRGPLIDQPALLDALEHGQIRGVALDTYDVEPSLPDSPWRRANYWGRDGRSRVITTPHMGYVDEDLMNTWYAETAENVERWLEGKEVLHRLA